MRGSRRGTRGGQTAGFGELATDLVGQDLGERYHIIKLLGAGGMGAVYQAWDAELGVAVALKTVRPEVAADPLTARMLEQRFKQELLLARKVTHKNIVRVHDIGEVDGLKYITMPFLDGRGPVDHPQARGQAGGAAGDDHRPQRGLGAGRRPSGRRRAPRPQAGQHHGGRRR